MVERDGGGRSLARAVTVEEVHELLFDDSFSESDCSDSDGCLPSSEESDIDGQLAGKISSEESDSDAEDGGEELSSGEDDDGEDVGGEGSGGSSSEDDGLAPLGLRGRGRGNRGRGRGRGRLGFVEVREEELKEEWDAEEDLVA